MPHLWLSRYCCSGIKIGPQETQNDKNASPITSTRICLQGHSVPSAASRHSIPPASLCAGICHPEPASEGQGENRRRSLTPQHTHSHQLTVAHTYSHPLISVHIHSHLLTFTHGCSYPLKPAHTLTPVHSLLSHTPLHQLIPTLDISRPLIPAHTHSLALTPAPLFTPLHICSLPPPPVL